MLQHELNSQPERYEGAYSYGLFVLNDDITGATCCNRTCGTLRNALFSVETRDFNHLSVLRETIDIQYTFLHHPELSDFIGTNVTDKSNATEMTNGEVVSQTDMLSGKNNLTEIEKTSGPLSSGTS